MDDAQNQPQEEPRIVTAKEPEGSAMDLDRYPVEVLEAVLKILREKKAK